MKFEFSLTAWSILAGSAMAFVPPQAATFTSPTALNMVLEKPKEKKLPKIEVLKIESDHLVHPLKEVGFFKQWMDEYFVLCYCAMIHFGGGESKLSS